MKKYNFLLTAFLLVLLSCSAHEVYVVAPAKRKVVVYNPPVFKIPPSVVVIPGTTVKAVVEIDDYDIYFYDGVWWCYYNGKWWKSTDITLGWEVVDVKLVPAAVIKIPPGWRKQVKIKIQERQGPPGYKFKKKK